MAARPHDVDEPDDVPGSTPAQSGPAASPDAPSDAVRDARPSPGEQPPAPPSDGRDDSQDADDASGSSDPAAPVADPTGMAPAPREVDVDAEWLGIVERLSDLGEPDEAEPEPAPHRRVVRPASGEPAAASDPADPGEAGPEPAERPVPASDPRAWQPDPVRAEAEDHFVPPDPGPVLGGDPLLTMAWAAVLVVPALLVLSVVIGARLPSIGLQIGGAVFAVGLAVLLWRMPRGGDDDDRGPGAVV